MCAGFQSSCQRFDSVESGWLIVLDSVQESDRHVLPLIEQCVVAARGEVGTCTARVNAKRERLRPRQRLQQQRLCTPKSSLLSNKSFSVN